MTQSFLHGQATGILNALGLGARPLPARVAFAAPAEGAALTLVFPPGGDDGFARAPAAGGFLLRQGATPSVIIARFPT
ncbi:hypothetical protein, partial [Rhodospirillum rubrum]|uniref:hypothetical protein n=2 Tax=Rhodospirillum rubrum TaxID=1085 RepID=UPI0019159DC6